VSETEAPPPLSSRRTTQKVLATHKPTALHRSPTLALTGDTALIISRAYEEGAWLFPFILKKSPLEWAVAVKVAHGSWLFTIGAAFQARQ
jgi:hypothetical protein